MAGPVIDLRRHGAVLFDLDVVVDTESAKPVTVDSTAMLVRRLRALGVDTAVFSPSGEVEAVIEATGIADLFPVRIDGEAPNEAARRLGTQPAASVVVTRSEATATTAKRSGFALVVGIGSEKDCWGADHMVADPAEITIRLGDRRLSQIPDAVTSRHELATLLRIRRPAVFLDFDGTLADIVNDPSAAVLIDGAAAQLARLGRVCPVAVISGRDLEDVRLRIGMDGIWYAGSHGFELSGPNGEHYENPDALTAVPLLAQTGRLVEKQLHGVPGVLVEYKRFGVTIHYRNVAAARVDEVITTVYEAAGAVDGLRIAAGRMVVEIRPDIRWDKGRALEWILGHVVDSTQLVPFYVGDDLTDEDAFDAVADTGVGIVVRSDEAADRRSAARFAVNGPAQVCDLLQRLADLMEGNPETASRSDAWILFFDGYDPPAEKLREALCTVGNGFFATRGCAPESAAGAVHYPGTYLAGIYNRLSEERSGMTIVNESLVNAPNWLATTFRVEETAWFDIDTAELLDYRQYLDVRRAVLTRRFRYRDEAGRTTSVVQRRFVAMHLPHVCALQTTIEAEDWSGQLEIRSVLDGSVGNTLVERYRELASDHLTPLRATELTDDSVLLSMRTNMSWIPVGMAARNRLWRNTEKADCRYQLFASDRQIGHDITVEVSPGESVTLEKMVTVFTGRDHAVSDPADEAARQLSELGRFDDVLDGHVLAWKHLWDRAGIELKGYEDASRIVHIHLLHLLQTVSRHTADLDVGVPARGLHGEAYRGHIFWDELFVFPVLTLRLPSLTRSLLRYRYRRLTEARHAASAAGYRGAMFPWQSGSDGREESQQLHLNPASGRWLPDPSWRQHHIGVAIAYNVWQYYQVTGDLEFLTNFGAELLAEIARFFASLATYDRVRGRYVIRGVMGPDEFHSGYPGSPFDGIDNNAYTNVMAVWVILRALEALDALASADRVDLVDTLAVDAQEMARWEDVSRRMFVPFHDQVISQFEGYDNLAELDWDAYRERYGNIQRLDRILEAEDDDVNRYRASKQADVLMLFYLLSADELRDLFGRLGYQFEPEAIPRTVDYYLARTSHGSTLSAVVHSWVLARANRDKAMEFFERVLASDIADIQGGTTAEGIHLAAMAGSVDLLQRCFTGLETRGDRLVFGPQWPEELGALKFPIVYRGLHLWLTVTGRKVQVSAAAGNQRPIEIVCRDQTVTLQPGCTVSVG
ncbi:MULTISPECIES: trehalose-phosphatase [Rhodococcus]|uniref:Trehalose-phosphatase n=1 Tax=Rhodococcus oxybenzonivorans TaxID=1990687 RepID=A0AAE4V288_9NOCA|nr:MULTISPECIES: trehalose-phosphatase [Rhodococcus]MDV7245286.1 trehalose-phosphatase [Rhodococcus oxybenzonivorans]MDV7267100.1 trehalose-phosphatase [Rhodococcus oxybenzonivorans]MDV7272434.1 trehalose-phosphatase [Rhodococcus oxybenzonivorans]MDV7336311.1 trehalose-phosphatase [Rhodococcus oxybenzonivorans]MDV7347611.1 trehalose-phosphatase [Rhodococcus oxybenzonivorans]